MENWIGYTVSGIFATALGSFLFWFAKRRVIQRKKSAAKSPWKDFAGKWYGIHITQDREEKTAVSEHSYMLEIDEKGNISGDMEDKVHGKTYKYRVRGEIRESQVLLRTTLIHNKPIFGIELFHHFIDSEELKGFICAYAYSRRPFVSPIILKRAKPSLDDYTAHINGGDSLVLNLPPDST